MHIYDFITDEYQTLLKGRAVKNVKTGRFEDVMNEYMKLFLDHFENNKISLDNINSKSGYVYLKDDVLSELFMEIHSEFINQYNSYNDSLSQLFKDIIQCYVDTVRGKRYLAVLKIFDVLEKNELLLPCSFQCINLFYRIRPKVLLDEHLQENFYYHLPFNERSKVKNQRFSVSGLPLLYLGSSIASCLLEYDKELDDISQVGLSCWNFDPMFRMNTGQTIKEDKTKIFDITNEFYDIINGNFAFLSDDNSLNVEVKKSRVGMRVSEMKSQKLIRAAVKKFILSQLCTFITNNRSSSFQQEYLIPQLLTESLMMHGFHGVLYPSTKFLGKGYDYNGRRHTSTHRSNLVLFPDYCTDENHDNFLIKHFRIEVINIDEINLSTLYNMDSDFDNKTRATLALLNSNNDLSDLKSKFRNIFEGILQRFETFKELSIDGKKYIEINPIGKIELNNIVQYLEMIMKQCNDIFNR